MSQLNRADIYFSTRNINSNESIRFNEPLPYIKRSQFSSTSSQKNNKFQQINSNYSVFKAEPSQFNTIPVYASVRLNRGNLVQILSSN